MDCAQQWRRHSRTLSRVWFVGATLMLLSMAPGVTRAQVPPNIEEGLLKIGHIVDPIRTSKLYRPLMPPKIPA